MSTTNEEANRAPPVSTDADTAPVLYRARKGRVLLGVCAGAAAYVGWDVWLIRGLFVALTCIGGLGVIVYIGGALLVPLVPHARLPTDASAVSSSPYRQ